MRRTDTYLVPRQAVPDEDQALPPQALPALPHVLKASDLAGAGGYLIRRRPKCFWLLWVDDVCLVVQVVRDGWERGDVRDGVPGVVGLAVPEQVVGAHGIGKILAYVVTLEEIIWRPGGRCVDG